MTSQLMRRAAVGGEIVRYEPPAEALLPAAVRRVGAALILTALWGAAVFVAAHV
ncbi:MAG: hypothetical protein ABR549_06230 [Mycobacteriales bacterium]